MFPLFPASIISCNVAIKKNWNLSNQLGDDVAWWQRCKTKTSHITLKCTLNFATIPSHLVCQMLYSIPVHSCKQLFKTQNVLSIKAFGGVKIHNTVKAKSFMFDAFIQWGSCLKFSGYMEVLYSKSSRIPSRCRVCAWLFLSQQLTMPIPLVQIMILLFWIQWKLRWQDKNLRMGNTLNGADNLFLWISNSKLDMAVWTLDCFHSIQAPLA